MINYLKKVNAYETEISMEGRLYRYSSSFRKTLQTLALSEFRTIESASLSAQNQLKQVRKVPLWITHNHLFLIIHGLNASDAFCINYFAVLRWFSSDERRVFILFTDGSVVQGISACVWKRQWEDATTLIHLQTDERTLGKCLHGLKSQTFK